MEEKKANALEMAAQEDEEREKAEKAAQGRLNSFLKFTENYINKFICFFPMVI